MNYNQTYYLKNAEKIKARVKAWYEANKEKAIIRLRITNRIWKKNNRKKEQERHRKYINSSPWTRAYRNIHARCSGNPFYVKKGIKALITIVELKRLWIRDNAHLLKHPSIDRIDPSGHYTSKNCRFIELSENLHRRCFKKGGAK